MKGRQFLVPLIFLWLPLNYWDRLHVNIFWRKYSSSFGLVNIASFLYKLLPSSKYEDCDWKSYFENLKSLRLKNLNYHNIQTIDFNVLIVIHKPLFLRLEYSSLVKEMYDPSFNSSFVFCYSSAIKQVFPLYFMMYHHSVSILS